MRVELTRFLSITFLLQVGHQFPTHIRIQGMTELELSFPSHFCEPIKIVPRQTPVSDTYPHSGSDGEQF